jgi:hypothetical protein
MDVFITVKGILLAWGRGEGSGFSIDCIQYKFRRMLGKYFNARKIQI